jgi:hypothetical protein
MVTEAYFTFPKAEEAFPSKIVVVDHQGLLSDGKKLPLMSTEALEKLAGQLGNISTSDFTNAFQNIFQTIYHLVHLDLGIIIDNRIYNSPQMFNLSIMPVTVSVWLISFPNESWISTSNGTIVNESRGATSNSTLMAQWRQRVVFYQNSDRVPVMDYL